MTIRKVFDSSKKTAGKFTVLALALGCIFFSDLTNIAAKENLPKQTALDQYIAKPDASYKWEIVATVPLPGGKAYVVDMVSQTWRTSADVNRTEWQHWLTIVVPDKLTSETGFLFIGGGGNGGDPPSKPSDITLQVAQATGTVVAELKMVPNQPLIFHDDGRKRTEDDLIGYTWDQYLKTGDATWPARNPMVKSAVRAMDTITALAKKELEKTVDKFVVAGGSKRGWTTWLTGAVDERVVAIVPIVIDVLNVKASMLHHHAAYGFWAPAIGDYVAHGITERMDHPRMQELYDLVDPYAYRHRLKLPKFIVCGSGDQFFLPDSSRFYFDDLQGEKHLRYVPNADHGLDDSDALESIAAFYWMVVNKKQRPEFTWSFEEDGSIRVKTQQQPDRVLLWQANNPDARDFRIESLGPKYVSKQVEDQGDGVYVAKLSEPEKGWTASFVELTYDVGGPTPLKFTTAVRVLPDTLPYADKETNKPSTVAITCNVPNEETALAIEKEAQSLFDAPPSAKQVPPWTQGDWPTIKNTLTGRWGKVTHKKLTLKLQWQPQAWMHDQAKSMTAWLASKGCDNFAYRLKSGL